MTKTEIINAVTADAMARHNCLDSAKLEQIVDAGIVAIPADYVLMTSGNETMRYVDGSLVFGVKGTDTVTRRVAVDTDDMRDQLMCLYAATAAAKSVMMGSL